MTSSVAKPSANCSGLQSTGQSDLSIMVGAEYVTLRCRRGDNHPLSCGICFMSCCCVDLGHGD